MLLYTLLLGVNRYFHAVIEQGVWLGVVENVEADFVLGVCVLDLEEEPLGVALGVDVVRHQKIILHL